MVKQQKNTLYPDVHNLTAGTDVIRHFAVIDSRIIALQWPSESKAIVWDLNTLRHQAIQPVHKLNMTDRHFSVLYNREKSLQDWKKKHHYFIFKINHFRCTTEKGYSRLAMTSLRCWSSFPGATIIRSHDNLSCLLCHQLRGKSFLHEHKVWPKRGWLSRLYWGCQPKWEHSPCFQSKMMTKSCQ